MIVHAGDITVLPVLEDLKKVAPVRAVHGNMDPDDLSLMLPGADHFMIEGVIFSVTHGSGAPLGIRKRIAKVFTGEKQQVLIYGHTHRPDNEWVDGVLFFNPGSPTDTYFAPFRSFGMMTLHQGVVVEAEIIRID